jgi:two-component system, NtrC family, response regulator AtoC
MSTRIMVVDDEASVRALVRICLERAGYEVSEASSAATLRQSLAGPAPGAVVLDLKLSDGDGLVLLPELKQCWPSARVIILTGYGTTVAAADQAYAVDDVYLVSKPFDCEMLNAVVEMALSSRQRGYEAHPSGSSHD